MLGFKLLTFGLQVGENWVLPLNFLGGMYEHPVGHNQFQHIPHCVAKFCENQFMDVKKSVDRKER